MTAEPKSIGEYLKHRRLELHLLQSQVAETFGVDRISVQNWERGVTEPTIRMIPRIIAFLGYDPEPEPQTLPRRIAYARRRLGLRQEDLAVALNSSVVDIWEWETGRSTLPVPKLRALQSLLDRDGKTGFRLR